MSNMTKWVLATAVIIIAAVMIVALVIVIQNNSSRRSCVDAAEQPPKGYFTYSPAFVTQEPISIDACKVKYPTF